MCRYCGGIKKSIDTTSRVVYYLIINRKGYEMKTEDYIKFIKTRTQWIDCTMEDFHAGLMSAKEALSIIRDITNEVNGFREAVKIVGFIN